MEKKEAFEYKEAEPEEEMSGRNWYEDAASKISRFKSIAVRKEKSPSVYVTVDNAVTIEATIDEGAELNCLDEDFCFKK